MHGFLNVSKVETQFYNLISLLEANLIFSLDKRCFNSWYRDKSHPSYFVLKGILVNVLFCLTSFFCCCWFFLSPGFHWFGFLSHWIGSIFLIGGLLKFDPFFSECSSKTTPKKSLKAVLSFFLRFSEHSARNNGIRHVGTKILRPRSPILGFQG